jgi:hypothetical protein
MQWLLSIQKFVRNYVRWYAQNIFFASLDVCGKPWLGYPMVNDICYMSI